VLAKHCRSIALALRLGDVAEEEAPQAFEVVASGSLRGLLKMRARRPRRPPGLFGAAVASASRQISRRPIAGDGREAGAR
jgi:hypothetical protein